MGEGKELLGIIKRGREVDKTFKEQIENGKVYICERQFKPEEIKICKFIYLAASIMSRSFCKLANGTFRPVVEGQT